MQLNRPCGVDLAMVFCRSVFAFSPKSSSTQTTAAELDISGLDSVQFGDEMREKEFCLRPNSAF